MNGRPLDQSGKYTYPIQVKSAKTWKGPEKGGRSSEIRRLTWVYFYVHVQIIFMIHGKTLRFTREDTHTLARECMFIYSDKRRLSPDPPGLPHAMMCRWLQPDVHWLDTGIVLIEKTHLFTWPFLFFLFASIIILYMTMLFPITHSKFFSFRKFDGDRVLLLFFLNSAWLYNFGKGDGGRKVERENHVRAFLCLKNQIIIDSGSICLLFIKIVFWGLWKSSDVKENTTALYEWTHLKTFFSFLDMQKHHRKFLEVNFDNEPS